MFKKLILVGFVFLFSFNLARAEVVISEVFFPLTSGGNPSSKQWIEVYNDTNSDIHITQYKIKDAGVVTGHDISVVSGGSEIIPPHEYGVIANTKDVSSVKATYLFYSALSITADNVITLLKDKEPISAVTLTGSSATGNSLQLINGEWKAVAPTPGTANSTPTSSATSTPNSTPVPEPIVAPEPKIKIIEVPKIQTKIMGKTLGFVGFPVSLDATSLSLSGEQLRYGKYFWNFGDGDSKEVNLSDSQPFTHTYFYPGDYVVSLDYFSNPYIYSNIPDASNQITIKIIKADISISKVGDEKDFFVELTNNTDYSVDLSNWFLTSDGKSFIIPRNTILQSKKTMIISPKITNFSVTDKDTLKLMTPQREIVFDYSASFAPIIPANSQGPSLRKVVTPTLILPLDKGEMPEAEGVYPETTQASVISSDVAKNNSNNSYLPIFISIIFIGASASAVYFIRQKKVISQVGSDFEILDE